MKIKTVLKWEVNKNSFFNTDSNMTGHFLNLDDEEFIQRVPYFILVKKIYSKNFYLLFMFKIKFILYKKNVLII